VIPYAGKVLAEDEVEALRIVGEMGGSDEIMVTTLFLETYPGFTEQTLDSEVEVINRFCHN